jgi:hypothetical protein
VSLRSADPATARNVIRLAISLFLVVLIVVATTGWIWTGRHQAASQSMASRVVLTVCILAAMAGLSALWRGARR